MAEFYDMIAVLGNYSTAVELMPHDTDVVGSNHAGC